MFALHVYPDLGINTLDDWRTRWSANGVRIEDGGDAVTPSEIEKIITERAHPRGLSRHPIDFDCIGHGEGTWDYLVGDFS